MTFVTLPVHVQNLVRDAADLASTGKCISLLHSQAEYKALSDVHKHEVTHSYYEALKYYQEWAEEENDMPMRDVDLLK